MQADGRAEERLGVPAVVSENREGWLASGHVARIVPLEEADESWIYCAIASDLVQAQISSLACGSMVDALYEDDLAKVILPPRTSSLEGNSVSKAWSLFSQCEALEKKAYSEIEEALTTRT